MKRAREPFRFYTRLTLRELTGKKARDLRELVELIKEVPGSAIFHHTHLFLQKSLYLVPGPANDFAYWVSEVLHEEILGERLASIEICDFASIRQLRTRIVELIEEFLADNPGRPLRVAQEGREFRFLKTHSFMVPTRHVAHNLADFFGIVKFIGAESIYFHMFEARLRLERRSNDFSLWLETGLEETELARRIARLDPYTYTLEGLRRKIVGMLEERLFTGLRRAWRKKMGRRSRWPAGRGEDDRRLIIFGPLNRKILRLFGRAHG